MLLLVCSLFIISLLIHEELAELLFLDEVLLDILLNFVEDNLLDFFDIFSVLLDLFAESFLSDEVSANTLARIKQKQQFLLNHQ